MISEGNNAYREIIYLCMELMRQFYDSPRSYRIDDEDGKHSYIKFSNRKWKEAAAEHPVELDVAVSAEKSNPYSRIAHNQTMTDLWKLGVFRPDMADSAKLMLKNIHLDGKEKLLEELEKLRQSYQNLAVGDKAV